MHIHILGICGTFMGGIAVIARESGFKVTGCDQNVYPPMSTQLEAQGIELISGYSPDQIALQPDLYVIGNVITRGNPLMEEILNQNLPYISGPQWLSENILRHRWVLAVSGTHGKTTTSSMVAWILEYADLNPGFLIGGIPENFGISARIGNAPTSSKPTDGSVSEPSPFFVIEADEYDTAFFDKRSKFVHYRPRTVILNNLEFDHADIFPDLAAIERQFHHLIRIVPSAGLLISNGKDTNLNHLLQQGYWTPIEEFGTETGWHFAVQPDNGIKIFFKHAYQDSLYWDLFGEHNHMNALAALLAARHAGVPIQIGIEALMRFKSVKRRMEKRGSINGITLYDDFAHHPTAIRTTLSGLRTYIGKEKRIIAVFDPRSNTMKMGVWRNDLANSLTDADQIFCFTADAPWAKAALSQLEGKVSCHDDLDQMIQEICIVAKPEDHILIMSNGSFGGIHEKILLQLKNRVV